MQIRYKNIVLNRFNAFQAVPKKLERNAIAWQERTMLVLQERRFRSTKVNSLWLSTWQNTRRREYIDHLSTIRDLWTWNKAFPAVLWTFSLFVCEKITTKTDNTTPFYYFAYYILTYIHMSVRSGVLSDLACPPVVRLFGT